jgi:hypothetical protein
MQQARQRQAAVLLPDGRVLLAGCGATAEVYDPVTRQTSPTGALAVDSTFPSGTLLAGGKVLIAGGLVAADGGPATARCELYDPALGTFSPTASMSSVRELHAAVLLRDGRVLATGGSTADAGGAVLASAEVYDPGTGHWTSVAPMHVGRDRHAAIRLADGRVLVCGGSIGPDGGGGARKSAEIYDPIANAWT